MCTTGWLTWDLRTKTEGDLVRIHDTSASFQIYIHYALIILLATIPLTSSLFIYLCSPIKCRYFPGFFDQENLDSHFCSHSMEQEVDPAIEFSVDRQREANF